MGTRCGFFLSFVLVGVAALACQKTRAGTASERNAEQTSAAPAAPAKPVSTETPMDVLAKLGPVVPEHGPTTAPDKPTTPRKTRGTIGEFLEGDTYSFTAEAVRPCGAGIGGTRATGPVIGVEVTVTAKGRLAISPRDVVLARGGIVFYASPAESRQFEGCTPLMKLGRLQAGESARGFVLFDVPEAEAHAKGLELTYQPTRWGGAPGVRVDIESF